MTQNILGRIKNCWYQSGPLSTQRENTRLKNAFQRCKYSDICTINILFLRRPPYVGGKGAGDWVGGGGEDFFGGTLLQELLTTWPHFVSPTS